MKKINTLKSRYVKTATPNSQNKILDEFSFSYIFRSPV